MAAANNSTNNNTGSIICGLTVGDDLIIQSGVASNHSTPHPVLLLPWNHQAEVKSKGKRVVVTGGSRLNLFFELGKSKRLYLFDLKQSTLQMAKFTEKSHVLNCLELAQIVMKPDEKRKLFSKSNIQIKTAANSITISCMKKLCEYEDLLYKSKIKKNTNRKSSGYTGMGRQLTSYRNKLIRLRGVTNVQPKDQTLISKAAARAQNINTPPEVGVPGIA